MDFQTGDDGNNVSGDGCSASCTVETGTIEFWAGYDHSAGVQAPRLDCPFVINTLVDRSVSGRLKRNCQVFGSCLFSFKQVEQGNAVPMLPEKASSLLPSAASLLCYFAPRVFNMVAPSG